MCIDDETRAEIERSPVQQTILRHLLIEGDDLPSNIAGEKGPHPRSVSRSLSQLADNGLVREKANAVYTLTAPGTKVAAQLVRES
jgi:Mn-dependent DtxR family transcriptional regulator